MKKTLFAVAALASLSLSANAFAATKLLGTTAGAKAAILKTYGLKSGEINKVSRENIVLAGGVKSSEVFATTLKQDVSLPGMKSLAAGTTLTAAAEKVGGKTSYKVTALPIEF